MNDKLYMENYLLILKSTMEVYVHGTLESSNKDIKDLLKHGLDETVKHQERCYNEMVNNGWYKVSKIDTKTIKQTLKNIKKSN